MEIKQNTPANMGKRVLSGAVILILLATFLLVREVAESAKFIFDVFVGFLMITGTFEVENLLKQMDRHAFSLALGIYPLLCFSLLILSVAYNLGLIAFLLLTILALFVLILVFFACSMIAKKQTLKKMNLDNFEGKRTDYCVQKSLNTVIACIYPTFLLCFVFLINHFNAFSGVTTNIDLGLFGLILLFVSTMFSDTFAMLVGRCIKSKKINLKKLGPGKSWSGFVGGIFGAMLGAFLVFIVFQNVGYKEVFAENNLAFWQFLIGGFFCGVVNMCGDIVSSYIKRCAGIKDFSNFIPGHGGVMDRINGLVFNSVFIYVFMSIVLA